MDPQDQRQSADAKLDEVELVDKNGLMQLRKELTSLMTDAIAFIGHVIGRTDPEWIERFSAVIVNS